MYHHRYLVSPFDVSLFDFSLAHYIFIHAERQRFMTYTKIGGKFPVFGNWHFEFQKKLMSFEISFELLKID